jgi:signal transduction histidine kinase
VGRFLPAVAFVALLVGAVQLVLVWSPAGNRIASADRIVGWDQGAPPPDAARGERVALPHHEHPGFIDHAEDRFVWYRVPLDPATVGPRIEAVLLWSQSVDAAAYLNGHYLEGNSSADQRERRDWLPQMFFVDPQWVQQETNQLLVRVRQAPSGRSSLGEVYVGRQGQVQPLYEVRTWAIRNTRYVLLLMLISFSLPMFAIWLRRDEREFLWLTLSMLTLAAFAAQSLWPASGLSPIFWDWGQSIGFAIFMACLHVFVGRLVHQPRVRQEITLAIVIGLGASALALLAVASPHYYYTLGAPLWDVATFILASYSTSLTGVAYWRKPDLERFGGFAAGLLMLITRAQDVLGSFNVPGFISGFHFFLGMPMALFLYLYIILQRLETSRGEAEALTREMSDRVLAKQHELEAMFEQLRQQEGDRLLNQERQRIMRDMHDGVGGALVSALAKLELDGVGASGTAGNLRGALTDLRLMVTSMQPGDKSMRSALAELRQRIEAQSADARLRLHWDMQDLQPEAMFDRSETLQVLRIVQEAFTNTLKHARSGSFSVIVKPQAQEGKAGIHFEMKDEGAGFDASQPVADRGGLRNMQVRCAQLRGNLAVNSSGQGTVIALWIPMNP